MADTVDKAEKGSLSSPSDIDKDAVVLQVEEAPAVGREYLSGALPPHESYEGRHRWDPNFQWDAAEERKCVRKTDMYLLSWICIMFFGLQLDRGNIQQALTDDLLTDLNLTSNDYNSKSLPNSGRSAVCVSGRATLTTAGGLPKLYRSKF